MSNRSTRRLVRDEPNPSIERTSQGRFAPFARRACQPLGREAVRIFISFFVLLCMSLQALAGEEVVTSAFRFRLPDEWILKRSPQVPMALLPLRVPDCEFTTNKYERNGESLYVRWDANTTFDSEYSDGGLGPSTPKAQFEDVMLEWKLRIKERKLVKPKFIHLPAKAPVTKIVRTSAWWPLAKRQHTMILALRDDGVAQIDLLAASVSEGDDDLLNHVIERLRENTDTQNIPPCPFKGTGGPELWAKQKPRPR
jgi:hypothetical protein